MKGRFAVVALFLAACAALIAPEARRYAARIDLNRTQTLIRYASVDPSGIRKKIALLALRDRIRLIALRLPNDVRPRYLLAVAAQFQDDPARAIGEFRDSMKIQERPEADLGLSRSYQAIGNPEKAALCALRALWLAPWLRWQLPKSARAPVESQIRSLEEELRQGNAAAIPELPELNPSPGQNDG